MNHELPNIQVGLTKVRGTRDQIASNHWIIKKARVPEKKKKSASALLTMTKALTV